MKKRAPQHQMTVTALPQMMQMQQQMQTADRWYEAKTDASHPTTTHSVDIYAVVVGFEVNHPNIAFKNNVHKLGGPSNGSGDYGHAFFYITKNDRIMRVFSFGPAGGNAKGKAYMSRPGNPDYTISENVRLFRLFVDKNAYDVILKETDRVRKEILKGRITYTRSGPVIAKQKYTALVNDTCAEEARDILVKGTSKIPNGTGPVDATYYGSMIPVVNAVNPYMWHRNFKLAGYKEVFVETVMGDEETIVSQRIVNWNKDITKKVLKGEFVLDPVKDYF